MGAVFGLFLPQLAMAPATAIRAARDAEAAGFTSFWLMDHLCVPGAPHVDALESWTMLSAVAVSTTTIRLGHLVGCNPFRHPAVLAKMAATLDHLSTGRFDLGLGWGSVDAELEMFGIDAGRRADRSRALAETIEIVRLMFDGDRFDYDGRYHRLRGAQGRPTPVQDHLPIYLGGAGPQLTMPLVARYADWWNCPGAARNGIDDLAPQRGSARISAQYAVGVVTDTMDRETLDRLAHKRTPVESWGPTIVGTPAELVDQFRYELSRGVEQFMVRFVDGHRAETISAFGESVIAAV
ncbi:LLM class flavin-dependent oxidoreductase [Gordonia alkanivorans]|uniref:LLM class flavin-dependent oxidoreductase n=1 Tax=Gordonia alkanivorans TaxID=84096 RepID=UPI002447BA0A|nr:LLM class flavin-dependent oxidoreductase [Gordonia alkanivorans]MDH3047305.1 LLM class flavin-dependent oxidoreductase [Gordonia alkanivorans]